MWSSPQSQIFVDLKRRSLSFRAERYLSGPNPADPADDVISALDNWVENGVAPEKIIATKYVNDDPTQGIAFQR